MEMKVKKVNRYYCEFCKKSGCSGGHIAKHEKHCTMNPNRICRMCKVFEVEPADMLDMLGVLPNPADYDLEDVSSGTGEVWGSHMDARELFDMDIDATMPKLREIANDCPVCILAALRQKGIPVPLVESFDYKKELTEAWSCINENHYEPPL
jgi:hypothetical protein